MTSTGDAKPDLPPTTPELKAEIAALQDKLKAAEALGREREERYLKMAARLEALEKELEARRAVPAPPPPPPSTVPREEENAAEDLGPEEDEGGLLPW